MPSIMPRPRGRKGHHSLIYFRQYSTDFVKSSITQHSIEQRSRWEILNKSTTSFAREAFMASITLGGVTIPFLLYLFVKGR